jgi:benzoyl-CoA reductase/2-hydroxyglutaryl-CoA dehydratase subunit BcrC/BadD/HgdB
LFPLVTLKGTNEPVGFYKQLRDEVKQRVDNKVGFIPNERFRLIWDLFPIYHNMRLLNYFAEFGAAFVTDMYANAFSGRLDISNPFNSLAERYLSFFMRSATWGKGEIYKNRVRKYHVDGIVFHSNRCCRNYTAEQPDIGNILRQELGIPSLMFEGNMVDPRGYDDAQVKAKIEAFIEMLEARKYPKNKA